MFHRRFARAAALCLGLVFSAAHAEGPPAVGAPGWVEATLRAHPAAFGRILEAPEPLRAQVVVGVLERAGEGKTARWVLRQDAWRADAEYFYPASAIKLPAAVAALARAAEVARAHPGFRRDTPLKWRALSGVSGAADRDPTSPDGRITLAWEIRKALVISDNDAFNRLFEFAGHREANERLWAAGMPSVRLAHRLNVLRTTAENQRSPRIDFELGGRGGHGAFLPERVSDLALAPLPLAGLDVGRSYVDPADGKTRVDSPMSFREKNGVSLVDLQRLLAAIVRPDVETTVELHALGLSSGDLKFLRGVLGEAPDALNPAVWKGPEYAEARFRPALPGVLQVRPREALEVRGKAGRAYGFHVENAYFHDARSRKAFFLAAVLHVDTDGVLNDGKYEYETLSTPFMANLGRIFARAVFTHPRSPRAR